MSSAPHIGTLAAKSSSCAPGQLSQSLYNVQRSQYLQSMNIQPAIPETELAPKPTPEGESRPIHVWDPRRAHPDVRKKSLTLKDCYALTIAALLCLAGGIPIILITWALSFLPCVVARLYVVCCPRPAMSIPRTLAFHMATFVFMLMSLPLILIGILWPLIIQLVNFALCLPYVILFCRLGVVWRNFTLLRPYMHFGRWDPHDIFQGFVCSIDRHGFLVYWCLFVPQLIWQIPVAKYVLISNPWLYELGEEYINQLTTPLEMDKEDIAAGLIRIASWPLQSREEQRELHSFIFSVNYPLPTRNRQTVTTGFQTPALRTIENRVMLTTVRHRHLEYVGPQQHVPASRSVLSEIPVYEVNLYYLNPYHYVTAYVEVNVTRDSELEHPSWLILGRDSWLGPQLTDMTPFFLKYAPQVEGFLREHSNDLEAGPGLPLARGLSDGSMSRQMSSRERSNSLPKAGSVQRDSSTVKRARTGSIKEEEEEELRKASELASKQHSQEILSLVEAGEVAMSGFNLGAERGNAKVAAGKVVDAVCEEVYAEMATKERVSASPQGGEEREEEAHGNERPDRMDSV